MTDGASLPTFFIVPHTHWEGAVFKTREEYLDMGLPNILRALALLEAWPGYRFALDQVCYIRPFLERHPEAAEGFRRFVAEGRLAIVGGTDVMLDVNMPGGESFVRQALFSKTYLREQLGVDVTVGWQLDTFGHHAQMPQLLKLAGFRTFWFFRGVAGWDVPAEFLWEGLDGTRMPAFWLHQGYGLTYGSPTSLAEFAGFMEQRFASLAPQARDDCRVGLAGADVSPPDEQLPRLVEELNQRTDAPFRLLLATPQEYEAAVLDRGDWPVVGGEMNPIFQGTYSSRIELKQRTRELERLLLTAEKLGVILRALGAPVDEQTVERAWEPMLFNQAHDLMSGVMTDHVHDDTLRGYDFSHRLASEEVAARLRSYASAVDTRGEGIPVVVFNSLGRPRTDFVTVRAGITESGVLGLRLTDPDGEPVPLQIVGCERHEDGSLLQADVAFVARAVPALGHALYRLFAVRESDGFSIVRRADAGPVVLENQHYRVECDSGTGAITSLTLSENGWSALGGPANVVVREPDRGDLWELYRSLDGGSRIAMTAEHPIPPRGEAVYSDDQTGDGASVTVGPVFSELSVEHPFGEHGLFRTTVRLVAGVPRLEFHTSFINHDEFVRYRAVFPTSIASGRRTDAIPFGAIERTPGVEFPAQDWVDWGDGARGVALLNRGLPGHSVSGGAILLSLCRSTRIVAYGFGGGYEPGMTSDSGLALGKEFSFDYALVPHVGDWRQAGVDATAEDFANPLLAVTTDRHPGHGYQPHPPALREAQGLPPSPLAERGWSPPQSETGGEVVMWPSRGNVTAQGAGSPPARWGLLGISDPAVRLSTLRTSRDGSAILRVHETRGEAARGVRVSFAVPVARAESADLLEDAMGALAMRDGMLELDLGPFEIRTVRLSFD